MQTVVDGILTNFLDIHPKQKNTMIVLHGWGSAASYWLPISQFISPAVRLILLDLPGFGGTKPLPDSPDVSEYTDFVRAFSKKLNLTGFILAGHSFGGQITLDYSLKYSTDLAHAILIAPAAIRERSKSAKIKIRLAKIIKPLFALLPHGSFEKFLGWYTPKDYSDSNEYQRKVLNKIVVYNLKPFLNQVKVLTDIIWGSEDIVIPYMGKYLAENIPHSNLHLIYGANHLIHHTHPQKLATVLNQIIAKAYAQTS